MLTVSVCLIYRLKCTYSIWQSKFIASNGLTMESVYIIRLLQKYWWLPCLKIWRVLLFVLYLSVANDDQWRKNNHPWQISKTNHPCDFLHGYKARHTHWQTLTQTLYNAQRTIIDSLSNWWLFLAYGIRYPHLVATLWCDFIGESVRMC